MAASPFASATGARLQPIPGGDLLPPATGCAIEDRVHLVAELNEVGIASSARSRKHRRVRPRTEPAMRLRSAREVLRGEILRRPRSSIWRWISRMTPRISFLPGRRAPPA